MVIKKSVFKKAVIKDTVTGTKDTVYKVKVIGMKATNEQRDLLQKFAETMCRSVTLISYEFTDIEKIKFDNRKRGVITIYNPRNVILKEKLSYEMNVKEFGKDSVYFIDDLFLDKYVNQTPMKEIVFNKKTSETLSNDEVYACKMILEEIYFLTDFFSKDSGITNELLRQDYIDEVFENYVNFSKKTELNRRIRFDPKILEDYLSWVKGLENKSKEVLDTRKNEINSEIYDHYRAVQKREKEILELDVLLESVSKRLKENNYDTKRDSVIKMLEPLLLSKKYKNFEYDTMSIKAYTNMIRISNFGKLYDIGEFKITVNLDGTLVIENLTNKKDTLDHPHILESKPCLGTIREQVQKMIVNFNFMPLFDLLYTFLSSYNRDGIYANGIVEITWGDKDVDWCSTHSKPSRECGCFVTASDSTLVVERLCPSTGDRITNDEYCEDCPSRIGNECNYEGESEMEIEVR